MTHFQSCDYDAMDGSYTLWASDFGVTFSFHEKHGRDMTWVHLNRKSGSGGDGMNIIGSKLDMGDLAWLAEQVGHTATKDDLIAINAVISDMGKGVSPKKHLENRQKEAAKKQRRWDTDPSP